MNGFPPSSRSEHVAACTVDMSVPSARVLSIQEELFPERWPSTDFASLAVLPLSELPMESLLKHREALQKPEKAAWNLLRHLSDVETEIERRSCK